MKKSIFLLALASALLISCKGGQSEESHISTTMQSQDDFDVTILSDSTTPEGARQISVATCAAVCSSQIDITVKDSVVVNVTYTNGCSGNTQGVSKLIEGMTVTEAISRLEGIDCGGRGTSCPDQLARALRFFLQ